MDGAISLQAVILRPVVREETGWSATPEHNLLQDLEWCLSPSQVGICSSVYPTVLLPFQPPGQQRGLGVYGWSGRTSWEGRAQALERVRCGEGSDSSKTPPPILLPHHTPLGQILERVPVTRCT